MDVAVAIAGMRRQDRRGLVERAVPDAGLDERVAWRGSRPLHGIAKVARDIQRAGGQPQLAAKIFGAGASCRFRGPSCDVSVEATPGASRATAERVDAGQSFAGAWHSRVAATHRQEHDDAFMVIIKANKETEAGVMPSEQLLTEMGNFNEELVKAGIMLAGEGLHPSSKGERVRFSGSKRTVIDGPFAETKELIAGFWLWQVKSIDEAIEWVRRCPNPTGAETEIEIRQVFEAEDFGAEFTPELREQEKRLWAQAAAQAAAKK